MTKAAIALIGSAVAAGLLKSLVSKASGSMREPEAGGEGYPGLYYN